MQARSMSYRDGHDSPQKGSVAPFAVFLSPSGHLFESLTCGYS